jgi:hypothetical protein
MKLWHTLSNPEMFLFSAKNSAGLFCLSLAWDSDMILMCSQTKHLSDSGTVGGLHYKGANRQHSTLARYHRSYIQQ